MSYENAIYQWQQGERRLRAAPVERAVLLGRVSDEIVAELRRRLGGRFFTEELVELYGQGCAWCLQVAMKAAPINEARVIDCDGDKSNVHCGTRAELRTTLMVPAPGEAEAIRETNLARNKVYSDCMAVPGS